MTAKIVVLDSFDKPWLLHCAAIGLPTADSLAGALALLAPGDTVWVGSSMRHHIPALAGAGAVVVLACELEVDDLAIRNYRAAGYGRRVSGLVQKVRTDRQELEEGVRPLW